VTLTFYLLTPNIYPIHLCPKLLTGKKLGENTSMHIVDNQGQSINTTNRRGRHNKIHKRKVLPEPQGPKGSTDLLFPYPSARHQSASAGY